MEPDIFVCYRRGDSAGHAGRIVDALERRFGKRRVFIDVETVQPGSDFVEAIEGALGNCAAFIAVIGRDWLAARNTDGKRRLDDPQDFIRRELGYAIHRHVRVVPVLVQGARMPVAEDLPEELAPLARLQALKLSDERWEYDVGRLAAVLKGGDRHVAKRSPPLIALGVAAVLVAAWLTWSLLRPDHSPTATDAESAEPPAPVDVAADTAVEEPHVAAESQGKATDGAVQPAEGDESPGGEESSTEAGNAAQRPVLGEPPVAGSGNPVPSPAHEPTEPAPKVEAVCQLRQASAQGRLLVSAALRQVGGSEACDRFLERCLQQDLPVNHQLSSRDVDSCAPGIYLRFDASKNSRLCASDLIRAPPSRSVDKIVTQCVRTEISAGSRIGGADLLWCEKSTPNCKGQS